MQYQRFDPAGCDFPQPRVPVLPTLSRHSLTFGARARVHDQAVEFSELSYARGRYALTDAYRHCGVAAGTAVLIPAYHCRTMLDPAIALGAEVALYPMRGDLAPDLAGIKACLAACQHPVKAMLVTHYFGFVQKLDALLEFCSNHDVALIEDCCHCFPTMASTMAPGRLGRCSVWSPYKFHPCEDGGTLHAKLGSRIAPLPSPISSFRGELAALARMLQRAWSCPPTPDPGALAHEIAALQLHPINCGKDHVQISTEPSDQYVNAQAGRRGLAVSRCIGRHTDASRVTRLRRQNYLQWTRVTAALPHCRALYPSLPADCVPYMFALYIDHPQTHFFMLKRLGMPIWRWDDMAVSACDVSLEYRLHLLHLPCHQELSADQMVWMAAAVTSALTMVPAGTRT